MTVCEPTTHTKQSFSQPGAIQVIHDLLLTYGRKIHHMWESHMKTLWNMQTPQKKGPLLQFKPPQPSCCERYTSVTPIPLKLQDNWDVDYAKGAAAQCQAVPNAEQAH